MRFFLVAALACALSVPAVFAQSVALQGGTSTLMNSSGGEVQYKWKGVGGFLSVGYTDQLDFGAYAGYRYRGYNLGLGDRTQNFQLGTDDVGTARFFYGRGVYLDRLGERNSLTLFGGVTTNRYGGIFYDTSRAVDPTGAVFFKRQVNSKFTFFSTNIIQDKVTSLQSFSYRATEHVKLGAIGGVGANESYGAGSVDYTTRKFDLSASYINAGATFQMVPGVHLMGAERVGLNGSVRARLTNSLTLTAEHAKMRTVPDDPETESSRGAVLDSLSGFFRWKESNFAASASNSESGLDSTHTYTASVSRKLFSNTVNTSAMFLRQAVAGRTPLNSLMINADENLTPQLNINQSYTRNGSANTISGGVRFVSNTITFGVGQQLYYSPLAGNNKVASIWTFNAAVRVFHSIRAHAESYVSENGNLRYTFWMDGFRFSRNPGEDMLPDSGRQYNVKFGKFIVRGVVVDETGQPVWGISVRVQDKMAYSSNAGTFTLYFNEGQTYPVSISPEQALATYNYEVIEVPTSVRAETPDNAPTIRIVVRKSKIQQRPPEPPLRKRSDAGLDDDGTSSGGSSLISIVGPTESLFRPVAREICTAP